MISTIAIMGQAGDPIKGYPEFRYINVESKEAFNEDSFYSQIPVMYWDRSNNNPLLKVPNGHYVIIFGRLESHQELGLFVLVEQMRHFPSNLRIHQEHKQK